jgi:hypothetical protein
VSSRPTTPDEIADRDRLRGALAPEGGFKTLDDFGKWLFGGAAVVGALATGFGISGFGDLNGWGRICIFIAVAAAALSFALVVIGLTPAALAYNPNSIDSMKTAIQQLLTHRALYIRLAAFLFALSLLAAGTGPIVSRGVHEAAGVRYSISDAGELKARVLTDNAKPGSVVSVWFSTRHRPPRGTFMPRARAIADHGGRALVTLTLEKTRGLQSVTLGRSWRLRNADVRKVEHYRISLPHRDLPAPRR